MDLCVFMFLTAARLLYLHISVSVSEQVLNLDSIITIVNIVSCVNCRQYFQHEIQTRHQFQGTRSCHKNSVSMGPC